MEQMIHYVNSIKRLVLHLNSVIMSNILYVCCGCVHIWSGRVAGGTQQGFVLLFPGWNRLSIQEKENSAGLCPRRTRWSGDRCKLASVSILAKIKEPYSNNQKVVGPKDRSYDDLLGLLPLVYWEEDLVTAATYIPYELQETYMNCCEPASSPNCRKMF